MIKRLKIFGKVFAYKILRVSLLPLVIREILQRHYVSIFYLHELKSEQARKVLTFLKRNYHILSLKDFVFKKDTLKLHGKSAIITIDDGFASNYELLPILKELNMPCTIFVCTGIINTNRHFWYSVTDDEHYINEFKGLENHDRKNRLFFEFGFDENKEYSTRQALNRKEIEEMKEIVDFQSHTIFHPILPKCDNDEAFHEIHASKLFLEREYGFHMYAFSYPNGSYGNREIDYVKKAGYLCALSTLEGYNTFASDRYTLKRISLCNIFNLDELCIKSSGLYLLLKRLYYSFSNLNK